MFCQVYLSETTFLFFILDKWSWMDESHNSD